MDLFLLAALVIGVWAVGVVLAGILAAIKNGFTEHVKGLEAINQRLAERSS